MRRSLSDSKVRYQLFLPRSMSERLEALSANPGATKSSILTAALGTYLEHRDASDIERQFAVRLDRLSRQLDRIERNGEIGIESLALFVRYMLTVSAPLAEDDEVARAIGRDRFAQFVIRVGRQLASGKRSFEPERSA